MKKFKAGDLIVFTSSWGAVCPARVDRGYTDMPSGYINIRYIFHGLNDKSFITSGAIRPNSGDGDIKKVKNKDVLKLQAKLMGIPIELIDEL